MLCCPSEIETFKQETLERKEGLEATAFSRINPMSFQQVHQVLMRTYHLGMNM